MTIGVSEPALPEKPGILRGADGKFLKGTHPVNHIRPRVSSVAISRQMLKAIEEHFPPERVLELMDQALEIALRRDSAKVVASIIELILNYQIGRPIARSVTVRTKIEQMMGLVGEGAGEGADENA